MSKDKNCTCETPVVNQAIPDGFKGKIKCAGCGGIATYPLPVEKYKGKDPIEEHLFNLKSRKIPIDNETALLTLLLRIEKKLNTFLSSQEKKK